MFRPIFVHATNLQPNTIIHDFSQRDDNTGIKTRVARSPTHAWSGLINGKVVVAFEFRRRALTHIYSNYRQTTTILQSDMSKYTPVRSYANSQKHR